MTRPAMTETMVAAQRLAERLNASDRQRLPFEILKLDEITAALIVEIDGVDFICSLVRVPIQRPRPSVS